MADEIATLDDERLAALGLTAGPWVYVGRELPWWECIIDAAERALRVKLGQPREVPFKRAVSVSAAPLHIVEGDDGR